MSADTLTHRARREALRFAADRLRDEATLYQDNRAPTDTNRARVAAYCELELELRRRAVCDLELELRRRAVVDQPGEGA